MADADHLLLPGTLERRFFHLYLFRAAQVLQLRHRSDHRGRYQACGRICGFSGGYDARTYHGIRILAVQHR